MRKLLLSLPLIAGNLPGLLLAVAGSLAWLLGGTSFYGPLFSILLPIATSISPSKKLAFKTALVYYLIGSVSINGAITGYYGPGHAVLSAAAWIGASAALALPWTLGRSWLGRLFALTVTAVPPLGFIGWLSPLNAAGVMFPGAGFFGLAFLTTLLTCLPLSLTAAPATPKTTPKNSPAPMTPASIQWHLTLLLQIIAIYGISNGFYTCLSSKKTAPPPANWIALNTRLPPARGNLQIIIANKQTLIEAGQAEPSARVIVFPEAVLDGWLPGTRQQFSLAVPSGQTWLIGAQMRLPRKPDTAPTPTIKPVNAVVAVEQNTARPEPVAVAAGLLLGGNWRPWSAEGLRPATQHAFELAGERVWTSLCVEQLQPWTWIQALSENPSLILAISNSWWSTPNSYAPKIQIASAKAWALLMDRPILFAINQP